jgi:type II secretory ATPase GspE/PulE/Tfp pilus assembly ATPase PilB-like protein
MTLRQTSVPPEVIAMVPPKFAFHYKIMPVRFENDTLTVAAPRMLDIGTLDGLGLIVHSKIDVVSAPEKDILEAIRKYYGVGAETIERMMDEVKDSAPKESMVDNIEEDDPEASIRKFVNQILLEAYKDRATDIHIEPSEDELTVRYRIDGVLSDAQVPANIKHFKDSISSRIKIMSNLDITEKRMPQDGRFKVKTGEIDLDLRVSFLPTPYGESIVIRILNSTKLYDFTEMGLSQDQQALLSRLTQKPNGIIFVTGPTGSGKTTTLYACLARLNNIERKIITIEDPIEYQLKGITQVQINPQIKLSFAAGLRSILRHDPDVIMIGEVRDFETSEIAIQMALTGHLVFSTLHTNDAAGGVTRLLDIGVESYLIASSIQCFIAQRLVRLLCPECKKPQKITADIIKDFGLDAQKVKDLTIYEAVGCESCKQTGYHGREGIYEFLVLTDEIRQMIMNRATATEIRKKMIEKGIRTLTRDGWEKVERGITSANEVIRVTQEATE